MLGNRVAQRPVLDRNGDSQRPPRQAARPALRRYQGSGPAPGYFRDAPLPIPLPGLRNGLRHRGSRLFAGRIRGLIESPASVGGDDFQDAVLRKENSRSIPSYM